MKNELSNSLADQISRDEIKKLLEIYDKPIPRYTSYPTAVEFQDDFPLKSYEHALELSNDSSNCLSIYVHLPFCQERCLFCGCHVIITPHLEKAIPYLAQLKKEVDIVASLLKGRKKISQLHLGGGTPTYYPPKHLADFLDHLFTHFEIDKNAELAVEVDPRVTTFEHIDLLSKYGFNRLSMGVQDFSKPVQESISRIQSVEQTVSLINHSRSRGFKGINIDLIYGLPHQKIESFEETIKTVISFDIDRCAVYSFAFVPWIKGHQKSLLENSLPDRNTKFELFALARELFIKSGYATIGMDHFAKPSDEIAIAKKEKKLRRNFQGYSIIPADDVIGLGISAIGDIQGYYIQNCKKMTTYESKIESFKCPIERGLKRSLDDEIRKDIIHSLMCNFHLDINKLEEKYQISFSSYFKEDISRLDSYQIDELVSLNDKEINVTTKGEILIRNIAACFDLYLREKYEKSEKNVFSQSV